MEGALHVQGSGEMLFGGMQVAFVFPSLGVEALLGWHATATAFLLREYQGTAQQIPLCTRGDIATLSREVMNIFVNKVL